KDSKIDRREFLKIFGGGIFIFMTIGDVSIWAQERPGRPYRPPLPSDFNAFLRISEDGRVACYTGKIEMGQGVVTSLAQMLADELDIALESVDMVMGDTDLCPWDMGTFGSMTTRFFGPPLRSAGAEARQVLVELAAEHLNLPVDQLSTENGVVYDPSNKKNRVTYARLTKGKKITRHASGKAATRTPDQFKIMGKPVHRQDAHEKVTGEAKYAADIQLPGMLYACILRPPAHDAKRTAVDLSEAKQVEGVQVIEDGDLIAVLHQYPDVAEKALSKIKVSYDAPTSDLNKDTIFDHLLKVAPAGDVVSEEGDLNKGKQDSATTFEKSYLDGYKAHAPIEPHSAVVHVEGDKATVWPSSQTPFRVKDEVAEVVGIPAKNVHVISPFVGGGFGGKTSNQQVVEAARLSKLTGKPIQVAWSRQEEFFYDTFRPAAVVKINSGIDKNGQISFWDYNVFFAGERGSQHFYTIPNSSTKAHGSGWRGGPGTHPFSTGAWRAPANNTNTFARESQMDIMASAAGMDPLEFRLQHLSDEKMRGVLQAAAEKFNWKPAKAPSGRGYGVACGIDAGTYVATMAEVAVDQGTGKVTVKRVVCAQDMGLVINPQGATIQMEGCITMGLGYALAEDLRFRGGKILDLNFDTYEIPRFSWLPKIETVIIDAQNEDPQGGGEPAIVTMGAVIANAIFDDARARVMRLPLTAERVKSEMS
ncbi:MAG: molybdopterin-dependent oxidoreductase, partial [Phycisphaerae bacterium]|nr:xanthine dehydrogenase family protein molybdopterin-binding subunit [candidate division Zixibacteria bacterium]NIU08881.1 xanthine dehydrogenase family protein molybdopterin-binding subunit [Phycisphaerae bacterium]NIU59980.1 molybdopterin-dependent oxidoreductase [Phycisphaerae bacterium]NIW96299.1 molybdopterin-dependent oxidoreductase [Phycisphaerae bacterium]NIX57695.1 molybdopterin-dependent oxidoreductase [candidate division Zixibacteria bacterium]